MQDFYRRLLQWTRTLHIYVSIFALLVLLFFAFTGFMLNHPNWFGFAVAQDIPVRNEELPPELVGKDLKKDHLIAHLRAYHGARGIVQPFEVKSLEPDEEGNPPDTSLLVVFEAPGYTARYEIDRDTGKMMVDTESFGLGGKLTDLHKGKATGDTWGVVIDCVSGLLLFVSLTGLLLWISLKKRLAIGAIAAVVSTIALLLVYFLFIPG